MLRNNKSGFTLVELVISLTVLAVISVSIFTLFISLVNSTVIAKRKSVALAVATNQMEYLKTLPYDQLAVQGGSIFSANPLPATVSEERNGITYTATISISYIDDAYDGCSSYPNQELKELYCRNYPSPQNTPDPDTNPQDYKNVNIIVRDTGGLKLAEADTKIASRVSETASATGALIVKVIDSNGDPVPDATINVTNSTLSPAVNVNDSSDSNGVAIFYGLPPDSTGYDYRITGTKEGFSGLNTIQPSGSLQPVYPSQNILSQQSAYTTLTLKPMAEDSLILEATTTSGAPLSNLRIGTKGGYKRYTDTNDTSYYYDTTSPIDTRPTTDGNGATSLTNLTPGQYFLCGDTGASGCDIGGTTYYLAAAIPYSGPNAFSPITVPTNELSTPPIPRYPYSGGDYVQKVQLLLTTNSLFPRITSLSPSEASIAGGTISNYLFTITGANLPCSVSAAGCATEASFSQNGQQYPASCTGTTSGTSLSCSVNLSGSVIGQTQLSLTSNGNTLTIPASLSWGGINVIQ